MNLLKKVIQLRENSHPDHEKPFLEHLEDLRDMIFRIVVTLLISMIVCFTFQKKLMEVLRLPVEQVWFKQQQSKLPQDEEDAPRKVTVEQWNEAKKLEQAASGLVGEQRDAFFATQPDQDLVFHARTVGLLRALKALPEENRLAFLDSAGVTGELREQVLALEQFGPDAELNPRGNLMLMSALKPTETFMLSMKLSFFAGIVLSFPLLLLYILQFVLPGLHASEKRVMWPSMVIGFGLFLAGVLFAYFQVLPRALTFFYEWGGGLGIQNDWRIGWYISFATQFTLLFGVAFELPVVVMVFVKLGMLSYETMSNTRRYAIVAIFVLAAVLTPTPDIMTLSLMALPMILLYEMCIWLAWFDRRKNRMAEAQEARERAERLARFPAADAAGGHSVDEQPGDSGDDPVIEDHDPYGEPYEYQDIDENWEDDYEQFHQDEDSKTDEEPENGPSPEEGGEPDEDAPKRPQGE